MVDDEPGGIQLRGKQLVFQAMSAIVVAVGIFLLGVMVGRGVPTAQKSAELATALEETNPLEPAPTLRPEDTLPVGSDDAAPNPSYQDDLLDTPSKGEHVKVSAPKAEPFAPETAVDTAPARRDRRVEQAAVIDKPAAKSVAIQPDEKPKAAPAKVVADKKPEARLAASEGPARSAKGFAKGFIVQVAAYQKQDDADSVLKRLVAKGYPAFIAPASTSGGTFFRVRVGGYDKEAEARSIASRIKREEHLEPWVTR